MVRSQTRKNRRELIRTTSKILSKLMAVVEEVHTTAGISKMFICVNLHRPDDILVIPFAGNQTLLKSLGSDVEVEAGKIHRHRQLLLLAELFDGGRVSICDGLSTYEVNTL